MPVLAHGLSGATGGAADCHGDHAAAADHCLHRHAVGLGLRGGLPLAAEGTTALVTLREILWIEASENYSRVYRALEPALFVRQSLGRLEEMLPADAFLRVSWSVILLLDRIDGIRWNWQQGTQLSFVGSDAMLPIGRSAARRRKDRLEG